MRIPVLSIAISATLLLSACGDSTSTNKSGKASGSLYGSNANSPALTKTEPEPVDNSPQTMVAIETSYGTMKARLYNSTPKHRDNFIKLANEGYYDDLLFHRVISGFMIQGGDPQSKNAAPGAALGSGGPGYTIPAEIKPQNMHLKGALSAARQGDQVNPYKESSGSQFYVVQGQGPMTEAALAGFKQRHRYDAATTDAYLERGGTPNLDGAYTVFGMVEEGMEVIDAIAAVETSGSDRPAEDIKMKVRVLEEKYTPE